MTRQEMLLTILAEECAEVAQAVSKALRFGLDSRGKGGTAELTNAEQIKAEIVDVLALVDMLITEGAIPDGHVDTERIEIKKERVEAFMGFSKKCGCLV